MRGLYTAGVLDMMMEQGFRPDIISGTSAGVTFGINMCSGQRGRVLRYNLRYAGCRDYISLRSLRGIEFYATVTNCLTGKPEYVRVTDCFAQMDVIRASASLPFVSRPVMLNGVPYLDGGLTDNIPLDYCLRTCDKVVVVLTRPKGYERRENLVPLARLFYPQFKGLHEALRHRDDNYNERIRQLETLEHDGRITLIRPSAHIPVGRLESNPAKLQAIYDLGVKDAQEYKSLI